MRGLGAMRLRGLQAATALVFLYLCAGELLPMPAIKASRLLDGWAVQEVVAIALLSCLTVLLASVARVSRGGGRGRRGGGRAI